MNVTTVKINNLEHVYWHNVINIDVPYLLKIKEAE